MDRKKGKWSGGMKWRLRGGHNQQSSNMVESGNQFDYGEEVGLAGGQGNQGDKCIGLDSPGGGI